MTDLIPIRRDQHLRILGMLSSYVTTLAGIDYPDNDEGDYHQRINENKRAAVNSTIAELRAALAAPVQGEAVAWARQCDLDESDPAIFVAREEVQESGYLVPLYTTPQPAPAQDVAEDWSVFIGYLIDKCEGHEISEERLQFWLRDMLDDPHYGALFRREKELAEQPSAIALSIEAAEEEHGSLRAAAKALDVDHGYLSRLKNGDKSNPSDELLAKLGLERLVIYRTAAHDKQSGGEE